MLTNKLLFMDEASSKNFNALQNYAIYPWSVKSVMIFIPTPRGP